MGGILETIPKRKTNYVWVSKFTWIEVWSSWLIWTEVRGSHTENDNDLIRKRAKGYHHHMDYKVFALLLWTKLMFAAHQKCRQEIVQTWLGMRSFYCLKLVPKIGKHLWAKYLSEKMKNSTIRDCQNILVLQCRLAPNQKHYSCKKWVSWTFGNFRWNERPL